MGRFRALTPWPNSASRTRERGAVALYEYFRERFSSAGLFSNDTHWGRSIHLTSDVPSFEFEAGESAARSCRRINPPERVPISASRAPSSG